MAGGTGKSRRKIELQKGKEMQKAMRPVSRSISAGLPFPKVSGSYPAAAGPGAERVRRDVRLSVGCAEAFQLEAAASACQRARSSWIMAQPAAVAIQPSGPRAT